jgi:hypothetical protein
VRTALILSAAALVAAAGLLPAAPEGRARKTVTFQQGVNGYTGTVDVEIWAVSPNTCLEGNPNASADSDNDGGESQILMRFDDIVSAKEGLLPPRATVHSATLTISAVHLHRMLVPWKRSATWTSMVAGVTADGLEASKQKDGFTFGKIAASSSFVPFDVTDAVQGWANGKPNHGWVFINTAGNGWDFYTSEFEDVKQRPKLVVEFTPPAR